MTKENPSPTWNDKHLQLQNSMKNEIALMREVLANLHEEEQLLINQEMKKREFLLKDRSSLLIKLSDLHAISIETTKQLCAILNCKKNTVNLKDILPTEKTECCETLILHEQLIALAEKIHLKDKYNENLCLHNKYYVRKPENPLDTARAPQRVRKTKLATYQKKG